MFYWCLSLLLCCVLLVFVSVSLLCSISVCCHPLVVFCQCLLLPPSYILLMFVVALCYTLFVLVVTLLLHSIDVHRGPSAAHYWCTSSPPCCVFLVFVGAPLLHSIGACWHPLVVLCQYLFDLFYSSTFLCCVHWCLFLVFYWCSLGFQIGISLLLFFFTSMQVWKFKLIS